MMIEYPTPLVDFQQGVFIVRDDQIPGGTKARYVAQCFDDCDELVYATPAQGGAQIALAIAAKQLGKRVVLFVAKRREWHQRTEQAQDLGAIVHEIDPGYLAVVQARAREYAEKKARKVRKLAPFGLRVPAAFTVLPDVCKAVQRRIPQHIAEVWCSAGSGTLATALSEGFPHADIHAVSVGHKLTQADVGRAKIHVYGKPFSWTPRKRPPFDADPHYEAKAWELCIKLSDPSKYVLFWNVAGEKMI